MKLKYYLRGLGIGIIVTTIILAISLGGKKDDIDNIPDEEVIAKATMLGMVMPEDIEKQQDTQETEQKSIEDDLNEDTEGEKEETEEIQEPLNTQPEESVEEEKPIQDSVAQDEEKTPYRLVVNRGDVCRVVCENLAANGIIDDAEAFRKYLSEIGYASNISIGSYDIPYELSFEEIANILKSGPIEE